ncbi:unnamed protein product [Fraxinus pennsylvanica]|uniref:RAB6-interacting golgin n=1 Tax=Fraxinus pennsylvanica TaxID=56036 RepID=A0AAD1YSE9_9LAMI|nr:unnamed protein product [Fraxinus pennsylvanica]
MGRFALSTFMVEEEEIQTRKMEVQERVLAHMGRIEQENRRLSTVREELEALADPRKKEVTLVQKKIDAANKELKTLDRPVRRRSIEFLWQEGHTAFTIKEEADTEAANVKDQDSKWKDFGSIFSTLLLGTRAKLEPLEGYIFLDGLEVRVSFGGVCKQSLSELSGGQRSLFALSLIRALLCASDSAPVLVPFGAASVWLLWLVLGFLCGPFEWEQ